MTETEVVTILAAHRWRSNAELIAAVHALGYLRDSDHVLDSTFGRGVWWKVWRPEKLTEHHWHQSPSNTGAGPCLTCGIGFEEHPRLDFRDLPYSDGVFDAAAFDPPYAARGSSKTTADMQDFNDRYGRPADSTPEGIQVLIDGGLTEMARVVKPKGIVLVKCQSYVWSGSLWNGTYFTQRHAESLGLELVDEFIHVTSPRPQPGNRTRKDGKPVVQVHARRNTSTLFVYRTPKAAKGPTLF
jgi:hypothetical protein